MADTVILSSFSLEELLDEIGRLIDKRDHLDQTSNSPKFDFIPRKEAIELLNVTPQCLNSWVNDGLLKKYPVRRKIYFKLEDINNLIENGDSNYKSNPNLIKLRRA